MEIYRTAGRLAIRRQCAAVFEENLLSTCYAWISSYSVYKVGDTDNVRIFFTLQKRLRILNKGRIFPREN